MRSMRVLRASLAALLLCATGAAADSVTLTAVKDNTLYQDQAGALSNGAGPDFFVGTNGRFEIRRGVVLFDLSSIPAGSVITSATLTLTVTRTSTGAQPVSVHRALSSWGEGTSVAVANGGRGGPSTPDDATWIHRFYDTQLWNTPGGDFAATASATASVGGTVAHNWSSPGLAADVQAWVNAPASNFGWVIRGNEQTLSTAKRMASRENTTTTRRPKLVVNFTPPGGTGACCLGAACQVLTPAQCLAQGGVYQGDGAPCSPSPCAPATGACCLPNSGCFVLSAANCTAFGGVYQGDGTECSAGLCPLVLTPFVDALPRPAVATPISGVPGGTAYYEILATEFSRQLHRDLPATRVWGYNDQFPGPTIEAGRDQQVTVTWINDLRDTLGVPRTTHYLPVDLCLHGPNTLGPTPRIVTHLHGGHVNAASDGYPEFTVLPGQATQQYIYPNAQPPATLWYHDHALGITRLNVYMGLAGFYLLRDAFEQSLGLPSGQYEVPLAIQDRSFNADGTLKYPGMWDEHFFGDFILVNGKVWPYLQVNKGKYRFRVLNGSNSRTYSLALSTAATFFQIGSDQGLLSAPVPMSQITLGPGERADLVVDFSGYATGQEIVLTNSAPAPFPGQPGVGVVPNVMKFVVTANAGFTGALPATLRPVTPIPEAEASVHREFMLSTMDDPCTGFMWAINDLMWDDVTEYPRLGTTEVWSFVNRSGLTHPMHMHLVSFQILDRQPFDLVNGQVEPSGPAVPPDPGEAGWKDTVRVNPREIVRVIARFEGYLGRFAYHCHVLEHEDHEMMRQFEVTCYANCDGSSAAPVLNVNDFACFINEFASGNPYANCDGSTVPPALNVNDFVCFMGKFAGGCN